MILAFDTYYFDNKAKTVSICFDDWSDEENYKVDTEVIENSEEYQSGEFYKRELPCILSLLDKIKTQNVTTIIIDGFVYLDDNQRLGLGGHLYLQLQVRYQ
jgi:exodeoxyribonuclease-5/deoxyribonuclease V